MLPRMSPSDDQQLAIITFGETQRFTNESLGSGPWEQILKDLFISYN